jgi:hypothetical protein
VAARQWFYLLKFFGLYFAPFEVVLQVVFVPFSWATLLSVVAFDQFTKNYSCLGMRSSLILMT